VPWTADHSADVTPSTELNVECPAVFTLSLLPASRVASPVNPPFVLSRSGERRDVSGVGKCGS
jgi:hypothetical protein